MSAGMQPDQVHDLFARSEGGRLDLIDLALLENGVDEISLYGALAQELQIPFRRSGFTVAPDTPVEAALRSGVAAVTHKDRGAVFALAPAARDVRHLLERQRNIADSRAFITTPNALRAAIFAVRAGAVMQDACLGLAQSSPRETARSLHYFWIMAGLAFCAALFAGVAIAWTWPVWHLLGIALGFLFFIVVSIRLSALFTGDVYGSPPPPLPDHKLPVYSIFVPLFREAAVLKQLIGALSALDYPPARLDVHILVEEEDRQTRDALAALDLPAHFQVTVLPPGEPRTKPRALNAGLALARGALCTVYDAEDRPEPDQLRKAAAQFAVLPADYACLQARLAVDHPDETWITKLFALEYAALFDVVIPGLAAQQLPFGLGGTSNHFRIAHLRAAGGWDAWNVTEDADIGMRLFRKGFHVGALDSTTFEEAPVTLRMWLNQRTRWMKGWLQTSLVHARAPASIRMQGRAFAWSASWALTYGTVISALFGPLLMALVAYEIASGLLQAIDGPLELLIWTFALTLSLVGTGTMIALGIAGARRRGLQGLLPWVAAFPVYYLLMSFAAWRAVKDLVWQPFHWRKTEHGLARLRAPAPVGAVRSTWPARLKPAPETAHPPG